MITAVWILVIVAVCLWFAGDILKLWFPESHARIKQRLLSPFGQWKSGGGKHEASAASSSTTTLDADQVRNAALHVANSHIAAGQSVEVAIEDAVTHIRLRTRNWNAEPALRRWLMSHLTAPLKARSSDPDKNHMNTANWKREIVALTVGCVVGLAAGWLAHPTNRPDRYSVHVLGKGLFQAVKLDKETGETWLLHVRGYWTNGPASE